MKTKKLSAIKLHHFQEVVPQFSLKLLLKNVICSPS
jgi:hypothetical protein